MIDGNKILQLGLERILDKNTQLTGIELKAKLMRAPSCGK